MELDFIRPAPFFFQDAAYLTVTYDLQQVGQHEVQVSESFILVQGVLC